VCRRAARQRATAARARHGRGASRPGTGRTQSLRSPKSEAPWMIVGDPGADWQPEQGFCTVKPPGGACVRAGDRRSGTNQGADSSTAGSASGAPPTSPAAPRRPTASGAIGSRRIPPPSLRELPLLPKRACSQAGCASRATLAAMQRSAARQSRAARQGPSVASRAAAPLTGGRSEATTRCVWPAAGRGHLRSSTESPKSALFGRGPRSLLWV
jgi:hypothetical protein